jgi:alkylation response protein AidB-like acyl-CoA dehydrogenase
MTAGTQNAGGANEIRATVRTLIAEWRDAGRFTPRTDNWMRGYDPAFSKRLSGLGLIGMTWPAAYSGGERSNVERLAATEELLRAGAPVAAHWIADRQIGPAILRHGSEQLRREILPGIVSADYLFCLGMSEPGAGSDLASVTTRATRADGGWRVRGRKTWTTGAHRATHIYLLARTEVTGRKHEGLTEFILDLDSPGVDVSPIVDMTGHHDFNEVTFDDAFVPDHRVLGTAGNGWRQIVEQLSFERGGPERVLSSYQLLAQCADRFPATAGDKQVTELGVLTARLATLRRLCLTVAQQMDAGRAPVQEAATLKYLGNAFEQDVVEFARGLLGAQPVPDPLFAHTLLSSPGFSIRGGAAEVMLALIARQETRR